MKETVLLTGGAGFIGSHIAVELLQRDYDVVIADDGARLRSRARRRQQCGGKGYRPNAGAVSDF